jgi:hypothetical protein
VFVFAAWVVALRAEFDGEFQCEFLVELRYLQRQQTRQCLHSTDMACMRVSTTERVKSTSESLIPSAFSKKCRGPVLLYSSISFSPISPCYVRIRGRHGILFKLVKANKHRNEQNQRKTKRQTMLVKHNSFHARCGGDHYCSRGSRKCFWKLPRRSLPAW